MTSGSPRPLSDKPESRGVRGVRILGILAAVTALLLAAVCPASWPQQALVALITLAVALVLNKASTSYVVTLLLVVVSSFSTIRYGLWRVLSVEHLFRGAGVHLRAPEACFVLLVLGAEAYSFLTLGLGYLQMAWPLRRGPVPLPADVDLWSEVDLLIPTLQEPLDVVKYTALAALNMDWPPERLNVYVLDDGRREEVRSFCAEAGIGYFIREDSEGAKAGNLNRALERTSAPFVAVFDADHVPVRSFLQMTMGWFDRDPLLGLVQTPHRQYSPDPFERNLEQFRVVPSEGELLYGVVQDGNDLWNATYFCGTGAVLRRAALDSVGGMATETVTEGAHTSLRMQKGGWNSAYINLPLAAGLATERLSSHIRQRLRWARGMVQLLRLEDPLFARGLTWPQRLCYFHATLHSLNALPRLIFLVAPLTYLVFGLTNIPGYWAALLAYAAPHLGLGYLANARLHGPHRFSFWNEVYETVLAPFLLLPTLWALAVPRGGRFEATAKGGLVERGFFDTRAAWPLLVLFFANIFGLFCAALRTVALPQGSRWPRILETWAAALNRNHNAGTVWVNVAWTVFNLMILSVAIGVARERRQRRRAVRLHKSVPAALVFFDGRRLQGVTEDVSIGGLLIRSNGPVEAAAGEAVSLILSAQGQETVLPATVVEATPQALRIHFDPLTLREEEALATVLYSAADAWVGWGPAGETDRPLKSLARVARLAVAGIPRAPRGLSGGSAIIRLFALTMCVLILSFSGLLSSPVRLRAQGAEKGEIKVASEVPRVAHRGEEAPGKSADRVVPLREMTSPGPIELGGPESWREMHLDVAPNQVIERAILHLRYRVLGEASTGEVLSVLLNGVVIGEASATDGMDERLATGPGERKWTDVTLTLPPELLVHNNQLLLRFRVPRQVACAARSCLSGVAQVDTDRSQIDLSTRSFGVKPGESSTTRAGGGAIGRSPDAGWREYERLAAVRRWTLPLVTRFRGACALCACAALSCVALALLLRDALGQRARRRLQT